MTAGLILSSCGNSNEFPLVKRSVLDASENENKELKNSLQAVQESYAKQNEELNSILAELSSISYTTQRIQLNVAGEENKVTEVDRIYESIDALKSRIDKLEKEASRARKLNKDLAIATKTIAQLRETVSNQEKEILVLKQTIADRDATIRVQNDTISSKNRTISGQKDKIQQVLTRQTEMLYQAGVEFETIADNGDFKISGRKDKANVKNYREAIYEKAAQYYLMAAEQGHPKAQASYDALKAKLLAQK